MGVRREGKGEGGGEEEELDLSADGLLAWPGHVGELRDRMHSYGHRSASWDHSSDGDLQRGRARARARVRARARARARARVRASALAI